MPVPPFSGPPRDGGVAGNSTIDSTAAYPEAVMLEGVAGLILMVVHYAVLVVALYALVHAALQRPDAYTAVDKLTKPVWLLILAGTLLLAVVMGSGFGSAIAACAAGVYLADVRPKLLEIQGKSR